MFLVESNPPTVFVHIPKTAGTSIKKMFLSNMVTYTTDHQGSSYVKYFDYGNAKYVDDTLKIQAEHAQMSNRDRQMAISRQLSLPTPLMAHLQYRFRDKYPH